MTYIPWSGLWAWNVQGPDVQYLSQPLACPITLQPLPLARASARCQFTSRLADDDGSVWTGDIQCGVLGWPAAGGTTWRCVLHRPEARCGTCGASLIDHAPGVCADDGDAA